MRKSNQEIKDPRILEEILSGGTICRIAMSDGEVPYLLPFNYGFQDGSIYIHSAPAGKKIDLLTRNGNVCFEVEQTSRIIPAETACKWATLYRSVIGYGNVEIITDVESKTRGLEIIMGQHGAPHLTSFQPREVDFIVILKLTIATMTGKQSSNWDKISNPPFAD